MTQATVRTASIKVAETGSVAQERELPVEVPVALVYDGTTQAVMMGSPTDLEDFAVGFSLSEGIVAYPGEIEQFEVVEHEQGIELRMWLAKDRGHALVARRRRIVGPTGCGLCGVESLDEAAAPIAPVEGGPSFSAAEIMKAMASLAPAQELNLLTRAVHGAGFWNREQGLVAIAEDVGRHNALDKLVGKLRRREIDVRNGIVLLTSRVSVEMVQKAGRAGAPMVVAVSAPTKLALDTAERAGITLVAIARQDGFEVFTHPQRIPEATAPKSTNRKSAKHAAA